ncbi:hypothetical protein ABPG75_012900 [Micractinium tetrahymenae]
MTAAEEPLPDPTSGIFLEVSFRRLLASCEDIVAGTSEARPDLVANWRRSPVFHHYIETLQEQLADLEAAAGSRLPRSLLDRYAAHVDVLASQLQKLDLPAFCSPAPVAAPVAMPALPRQNGQHPSAAGGAAAGAPAAPAAAPAGAAALQPVAGTPPVPPWPAVVPPPVPVARTPQLPQPAAQKPTAVGAAAQPPPERPQNTAQGSRLQTQQQLHEDLTDELAGMAARLKSNTLAIEGRLKEREQLLDSTETALDTSLRKTRESKERATQIHRRGRANFCLTCLIMLIVGLTFAAMYVFIKLTRFAGYRAAAPLPAAAPGPPVPGPGAVVLAPTDGLAEYERHYEL